MEKAASFKRGGRHVTGGDNLVGEATFPVFFLGCNTNVKGCNREGGQAPGDILFTPHAH